MSPAILLQIHLALQALLKAVLLVHRRCYLWPYLSLNFECRSSFSGAIHSSLKIELALRQGDVVAFGLVVPFL
jgi:hypothetical protein